MDGLFSLPILETILTTKTYSRRNKLWTSYQGSEFEVHDVPRLRGQHIRIGDHLAKVHDLAGYEAIDARDPMERLSQQVSRFSAHVDALREILPDESRRKELTMMFEDMVDAMHSAGGEITKYRRLWRRSALTAKDYMHKWRNEEKRANDGELMVQHLLSPKSSLSPAHFACLRGMSVAIFDMAIQALPKDEQKRVMEETVPIASQELSKFAPLFFKNEKPDDAASYKLGAVHLAAVQGRADLLEYICDKSADAITIESGEIGSFEKASVLDFAAASSDLKCFEVAASNEKNSRAESDFGKAREGAMQTFQFAFYGGNLQIVEKLRSIFSHGVDPLCFLLKVDDFILTCGMAARGGHESSMNGLFGLRLHFLDPSCATRNDRPPIPPLTDLADKAISLSDSLVSKQLFWSAFERETNKSWNLGLNCVLHLTTLKWFIKIKIEPDSNTWTALAQYATLMGAQDCMELIWSQYQRFIDLSQRWLGGLTLAHCACISDSNRILEMLKQAANISRDFSRSSPAPMDEGFLLDIRNIGDNHIAHISAQYGSNRCLQWIYDNFKLIQPTSDLGTLPKLKNGSGQTLFHIAAENGQLETLKLLDNLFPLSHYEWLAILAHHHLPTLQWLLNERKCSILVCDGNRENLMHLATRAARIDILNFLMPIPLKEGSPKLHNRRNAAYDLPIHLISQVADPDSKLKLLRFFHSREISFKEPDVNGRTIAHLIALNAKYEGDVEVLAWIKNNTSINFQDETTLTKEESITTVVHDLLSSEYAAYTPDSRTFYDSTLSLDINWDKVSTFNTTRSLPPWAFQHQAPQISGAFSPQTTPKKQKEKDTCNIS